MAGKMVLLWHKQEGGDVLTRLDAASPQANVTTWRMVRDPLGLVRFDSANSPLGELDPAQKRKQEQKTDEGRRLEEEEHYEWDWSTLSCSNGPPSSNKHRESWCVLSRSRDMVACFMRAKRNDKYTIKLLSIDRSWFEASSLAAYNSDHMVLGGLEKRKSRPVLLFIDIHTGTCRDLPVYDQTVRIHAARHSSLAMWSKPLTCKTDDENNQETGVLSLLYDVGCTPQLFQESYHKPVKQYRTPVTCSDGPLRALDSTLDTRNRPVTACLFTTEVMIMHYTSEFAARQTFIGPYTDKDSDAPQETWTGIAFGSSTGGNTEGSCFVLYLTTAEYLYQITCKTDEPTDPNTEPEPAWLFQKRRHSEVIGWMTLSSEADLPWTISSSVLQFQTKKKHHHP